MSHGCTGKHMTRVEIDNLESSFDSPECIDYVQDYLIEQLDSDTSIGVCKFWLASGYDALSDKQKNVVKTTLQQNLLKCGRCEEFLWEEADFIIENGLCTCCQKSWDSN